MGGWGGTRIPSKDMRVFFKYLIRDPKRARVFGQPPLLMQLGFRV